MGLLIGTDRSINVEYSDFYQMVAADVENNLLRNAISAGVPNKYLMAMLSGTKTDPGEPEPEEEAAEPETEPEPDPEPEPEPDPEPEPEKTATQAKAAGSGATVKKRVEIDRGKIMALKRAGWDVKDIAIDMGLKPQTVSTVIWQEKQKEDANDGQR